MTPDYLAEIERVFLARVGRGLMLSARDVERVERWSRAGTPLAVVLRGIEAAFDRQAQPQRVRSLAFAAASVEQAIKAWKAADVGGRPKPHLEVAPPPLPESSLGQAFDALLAQLNALQERSMAGGLVLVLDELAAQLRGLRDEALAGRQPDPFSALEGLENTALDAALEAVDPPLRQALEREVAATLAPERRYSTPGIWSQTFRAQLRRRLRQRLDWPALELRLSP